MKVTLKCFHMKKIIFEKNFTSALNKADLPEKDEFIVVNNITYRIRKSEISYVLTDESGIDHMLIELTLVPRQGTIRVEPLSL